MYSIVWGTNQCQMSRPRYLQRAESLCWCWPFFASGQEVNIKLQKAMEHALDSYILDSARSSLLQLILKIYILQVTYKNNILKIFSQSIELMCSKI